MKTALTRRLFVVLLANNDHGKSHMMLRLLSQGTRRAFAKAKMGERILTSPWGREIDTYLFVRAYQEELRQDFGSVEAALDGKDPNWRQRELIIWSSHLGPSQRETQELDEMIRLAHSGGFDAIGVMVLLDVAEIKSHEKIWSKPWDERWTLFNPQCKDAAWEGQVDSLAHDLWTRISAAITGQ